MIFLTADDDSGGHPNTRMNDDIKMDFDAFLRLKKAKNIECGETTAWEVAKDHARIKADLTAASKHVTKWTRELVFLGYEYLVVRDEVETVGDRKVQQQWRLHLCGDAKSDGATATTTLAGSKLFCRTLLPADPKIVAEAEGPDRLLRIVSPQSDDEHRTTYLHVLWPTDEGVDTMPEASVKTDGGKMTVRVGVREYTFAE